MSSRRYSLLRLFKVDGSIKLDPPPPPKKRKEFEKVKKEICQIFTQIGLRITTEVSENIVNFLDVTLDLNTGKFKPYSKPTTTPLSVDSKSNHPPNIIRNIPKAISSDEETKRSSIPIPGRTAKERVLDKPEVKASIGVRAIFCQGGR